MCRQPPASERLPSQRERLQVRDARKEASEAADKLRIANEEKQVALDHRNAEQARLKELDKELERLRPPTLDGKKGEIPRVKERQLFNHAEFGVKWLKRFHVLDIPPLIISVLKQLGREKKTDLTWATLMHDGFKTARSALLRKHEEEIGEHLATHVYTADHFSLLRLIGGMSKRLCGLIEQSIKYVHHSDGTKSRQYLHPDAACSTPAPSLFSVRAIDKAEARAEKESQFELSQHADKKGADICGKAYALDHAILESVKNCSRAGGMATSGEKNNPHLICVSGDGAGVSGRDSGVRVGHFPGTTNLLNQSSLDVTTWVFYKECHKAEDYTVLAGRLSGVLPDLRRLYNNGEAGELLADGETTCIFIKLVLVADKPFIRHVCGLLSHNANAFGAPMCECCDETHRPALYDFTHCTHTHYGNTTFEDLCYRAHVAPFEALGQREPEHWYFECPCCAAKFGTDHGGCAALDELDAKLSAMEAGPMASALKAHADKHLAQQLRRSPLLPFHYVVHDPMHAVHNEANALLDEAVHKHLVACEESTDNEVQAVGREAQGKINKEWVNLPKLIQFGKDDQGHHSHALNGPCFEAVWGKPQLIVDTVKFMEPVYALLEARKLTPPLTPEALAAGDLNQQAVVQKGKKGGKAQGSRKKAKRAPKNRRADFGDEEEAEDEGETVRSPPSCPQTAQK